MRYDSYNGPGGSGSINDIKGFHAIRIYFFYLNHIKSIKVSMISNV